MEFDKRPGGINSFNFEGRRQMVSFVETTHVTDGVDCDVYTFDGDTTKDLGIIRIAPNWETPLQKVLNGEKTIEGYLSGKGKLVITKTDGSQKIFTFDGSSAKALEINVEIGELMQWQADKDTGLTVYEICFPPYQDGRYENLD